MNETLLIWLFGGMSAWLGAITAMVLLLKTEVTKIRTILIITSKRAAEILHSPDDHLGLDELLDNYKKHHHDLPLAEWEALKARCEEVIANPNCTKSERLLALVVVEFSTHKLSRKF